MFLWKLEAHKHSTGAVFLLQTIPRIAPLTQELHKNKLPSLTKPWQGLYVIICHMMDISSYLQYL